MPTPSSRIRSDGPARRSSPGGRGRWLLGLACGALIVALGCPFTPRDTPLPIVIDPKCSGGFTVALADTLLRDNVKRAFECRLVGQDYQPSLAVGFSYSPDPTVDPSPFVSWGVDQEVLAFQNALNEAPRPKTVSIRFDRFHNTGHAGTDLETTRYEVQYLMLLGFDDGHTERYGGCANWDLAGISQNAVTLKRWEDVGRLGDGSCPPSTGGPIDGSLAQLRLNRRGFAKPVR
jgi:hypothetical protein